MMAHSLNPHTWKQRQEDFCDFEASLVGLHNEFPDQPGLPGEILSQKRKKKEEEEEEKEKKKKQI